MSFAPTPFIPLNAVNSVMKRHFPCTIAPTFSIGFAALPLFFNGSFSPEIFNRR
uniref:Uncharacterized protein n=1 Tax=Arundo donax TaxID=35708 RepID=A0A0A9CPW6_ARUDO